jgi:hypothetical protein
MGKGRDVRAFDYVNHPYDHVREELLAHADEIFRDATRAAAVRAHDVAAGLRVNIAGLEIGSAIAIAVTEIDEEHGTLISEQRTRLSVEWEAAKNARLFPEMNGTLAVYPLTARETQLDFAGTYEPPLGPLGSAIDAAVGHRIAESSIHRFVTDVAGYLRRTLADR